METKTYIKNIRISPKKLRFISDEVKKKPPIEAMNALFYSPKRSAKILWKVIKSAVDNAKKILGVEEERLRFKLFTVEEGNRLKRFRPGGRGVAKPYRRRISHIKIVLSVEDKLNKVGDKKILNN